MMVFHLLHSVVIVEISVYFIQVSQAHEKKHI